MSNFACYQKRPWKDAGVVDRDGLENRCTLTGTQGSNPCLSAKSSLSRLLFLLSRCDHPRRNSPPPFGYKIKLFLPANRSYLSPCDTSSDITTKAPGMEPCLYFIRLSEIDTVSLSVSDGVH